MDLYKTAESVLCKARRHKGSVKNLIFASKFRNPKQLFALVCETLKYWKVLEEIITVSKFSKHSSKVSNELAAILVYDHLFGKGVRCGGKFKFLVLKHKLQLKSALARIKIRESAVKNSDLLSTDKSAPVLPKYLRINALLTNKDTVLKHFHDQGYKLIESGKNPEQFEIGVDEDINNLLVFHHQLDLHDDPLYKSGKVIFQDKASCMPAQILNPKPNSQVIDACAAPGNKTSHMAALMQNSGKIFAFDLSAKRLKTMDKMLCKAGVTNCVSKVQDFLLVDPLDPLYSKVSALLVDPSCSGSGIVSRMNDIVDQPDEDIEARLAALSDFQCRVLNHALSFPSAERVVYSTCSVHEDENEKVVKKVLSEKPDFVLEDCLLKWKRRGNPTEGLDVGKLVRCDPAQDGTNGFFVALFVKKQLQVVSETKTKKAKRKRRKNIE